MKLVKKWEELMHGDHVSVVFPVDSTAHYEVVSGVFKSLAYQKPEVTGNNDLTLFMSYTTECEFDALSGTRVSKDTSDLLNLRITEDNYDTVLVFVTGEDR